MFWKFDLNTTSHVDKLLDKENVTLQELMDEDDLLQECKAQNRKLLDFLCRQQCMEELVSLITQDPPLDMEEKVRFKYPNTACELLTSDVPQINDKLGGDETLLNLLYDFLDHEPPLNPLLASFFSKTIGNLIARKTEQVIAFLKKKDGFIGSVLRHLGTSAMMDLLLRLVSCVEPAGLRQEVLHWLNEEKIIERLVGLIHPGQEEDRQSNASQTLCDIVRLGRDQSGQLQETAEPDPLLAVLESQGCVEQLLGNMFDGDQTESCLVHGTQVLLTLLEARRAGTDGGSVDSFSQGPERPHSVSSSVLQGIEPRLRDFHRLLLSPPKKSAILTTIGVLEEPLGNARLHGARLVAALLHTNTPSVNRELCRLNTMDLLLDLFFKYTWNNFLHFQVELCIAAILSHAAREDRADAGEPVSQAEPAPGNGTPKDPQPAAGRPEDTLVTHLFQKCCLVQRILEAWEANDHTQAAGGMRRGNMGHLTRIANAVVQNLERGPVQTHISEVIRGLPEDCRGRWESFVEETLTETNHRNAVDLVSTHHLHSSSEDEDIDSAFPSELSLQQAFSEYQIQQMTASFVDQFGFNDEEFADQDDNINAPFDRVVEISFSTDADDDSPHAALFEACCSERIQPFDDEDEDDDIWEDGEPSQSARVTARARFGAPRAAESGSQSGLECGGHSGSVDADASRRATLAAGGSRSSGPLASVQKEGPGVEGNAEGAGWAAMFDEPVSAALQAPGVALDVGSSVWAVSMPGASAPEEKGWAKFTDFQPFCCSDSGPRCSSPVDTDGGDVQGGPNQCPEKTRKASFLAASPTHPSAWNTCVPRKAPPIASGGSCSETLDREDIEQNTGSIREGVGSDFSQETPPRATEAVTRRADHTPSMPLDSAPWGPAAHSITADATSTALNEAGSPKAALVTSTALAVVAPPGPIVAVTTVAPLGTKDRKTDAPPSVGATANGPL
ncbi:serine/threonine-protein phosphatase 6 regulatory subunit 2 [Trichechus manatus latirostris]|uniref:Serine/threonine-protein phosphatase 6 regulatory subunit 2 n=1 Tax=Trichechus manatus latirostris TaxID=127582 RepID=A0A2Y9RFR9_TRIMA|nr:serine/threonine-protein phosphatase 6 regulatory subunit 2 [Trichechus manatus latirostris]